MSEILNLTQHKATAEQIDGGVVGFDENHSEELKTFLTFNEMPSGQDLYERAYKIGELALQVKNVLYPGGDVGYGEGVKCMIGGAPYFMSTLESVLRSFGFVSVYAFSERVSEEKEVDGKVIKTLVFKHLGFVEVV